MDKGLDLYLTLYYLIKIGMIEYMLIFYTY